MSKYRNVRTVVDGRSFASKAEAERYGALKLLARGKKIDSLQLQPRFPLVVGGQKIATYVGDFLYVERSESGLLSSVVEDVKGMETDVFKLKAKLFRALYPGYELRLVRA
jgi:hypothetical protein